MLESMIGLNSVSGSTRWVEVNKLLASDGAANDYFSRPVAISGDGSTAIVGSYGDDDLGSNSGSAYFFEYGQ